MGQDKLRVESRLRELEEDKEKLIKDNVTLIRENDNLKSSNKQEHSSMNERAEKHNEIIKIMKKQIETLEERCEGLEKQNRQLRYEKEEDQVFLKMKALDREKENESIRVNTQKKTTRQESQHSPTFRNFGDDSRQLSPVKAFGLSNLQTNFGDKIPGKIAKKK